MHSFANGVSADGSVVVGSTASTRYSTMMTDVAFRWTAETGMVSLGTLNGGPDSFANGVSADGSVVVGESDYAATGAYSRAFRWTAATGMVSLGRLNDGNRSSAKGVNADGSVVVGNAENGASSGWRAFRWTAATGMISLGLLNGGASSFATGVSADGSVVVGYSENQNNLSPYFALAFRWTAGTGMVSLGVLNGGTYSFANGVSADGRVVVGYAYDGAAAATGSNSLRAFRWTEKTGMLSVEDWLRASGVTVPADITASANATNSDGSVVVGQLQNDQAFIARGNSGLITLADIQDSLGAATTGSNMALTTMGTVLQGAHSRPLAHRVAAGRDAFWLAGDWGRDDHGSRNGDIGLAEVGLGRNFGPVQVNISLGQTWAKQNLALNGRVNADGTYVVAEALVPLSQDQGDAGLYATLSAYGHWGDADIRRGYQNAGVQDSSNGDPNTQTWGVRARLDWENLIHAADVGLSPYVDLDYAEARLDAYTETDGGFPARFDARKDKATELRLGINASQPIAAGNAHLLGTLEAAHRFEQTGMRTSGQIIGLFGFDLPGQNNERDWLRAGVGIEGKLGEGVASLMLNATTKGSMPNAWLAASWQMTF